MLSFVLQQYKEELRPRALMITGPVVTQTYYHHIGDVIGAGTTP